MNNLLKNIAQFKNRRSVVAYSQNVGDIITGILSTHNRYRNDYDNICMNFNSSTLLQIGNKLYNFLLKNTHYIIEPDNYQTLRSPAAILTLGAKKNVGLDCKSYSLFIGGILDALHRKTSRNINWCYRFASYKPFEKTPHHVFVVINPDTNNEIWIDCCINKFNFKKYYYYKTDRKTMLYSISGVGRPKKTREQKKNRAKKIKQNLKQKIKNGLKVVVKFNPATAVARNSFLLLVKINAFNIAKKLFLLIEKDNTILMKFWSAIGGNYRNLVNNIKIGSKQNSVSGVGVVVAASATAAATPIILKIIVLLKKAGINTDELQKKAKDILKKLVDDKVNDFAAKLANKEIMKDSSMDNSSMEDSSMDNSSMDNSSMEDSSMEDSSMDSEISGCCTFIHNKKIVRSINQLFK